MRLAEDEAEHVMDEAGGCLGTRYTSGSTRRLARLLELVLSYFPSLANQPDPSQGICQVGIQLQNPTRPIMQRPVPAYEFLPLQRNPLSRLSFVRTC